MYAVSLVARQELSLHPPDAEVGRYRFGGLAAISAGIAEALIATAFGFLVAIPAVWMYNYFQTVIDNVVVEMTYTSKELIDFLIKSVGSEFGRSIFTKEFKAAQAGDAPIT